MSAPSGSSPALPWFLAAVVVAGLATFAATRDEDEPPPPPPTTTTTFPRRGYVDEISAALRRDEQATLDEAGARCIAGALVDTLGTEALEALADDPAPLAALTPVQREQVLRLVVTCVDPSVAEALLGSGATTTEPAVVLPDEGQ